MSLPVVDATHSYAFLIRAVDHIGAVSCDPRDCVINHALHRLRHPGSRVGTRMVYVRERHQIVRYEADPSTAAAIHAYDLIDQLLPVGFRVVLNSPRVKLGDRAGEQSGSDVRSGKGNVTNRRPALRRVDVRAGTHDR